VASTGPRIDDGSPRALFSAWVEEARAEARPPPSDLAAAYLAHLLMERLRAGEAGAEAEPTLAEAWLAARCAEGARRLRGLRAVGDRALFVAGFFGESLTRKPVGVSYYRDIGQAAYGDLSAGLARTAPGDGTWGDLYAELADRFAGCLAVLAAVGDRARAGGADDVLHLYERWIATGSASVRRRLAARGCIVGPVTGRRRLQ